MPQLAITHPFPAGAVSLTYDDGLPCHLDVVAPALLARGMRGTFFVPTGTNCWKDRRSAWEGLRAAGHELGGHTRLHPTSRALGLNGPFIEDHTAESYMADVQAGVADLGGAKSFAYPCYCAHIGDVDLTPYVERAGLYGRWGPGGGLHHPVVGLARVSALNMAVAPIERVLELVAEAGDRGLWLVLSMHGVGADYLSITTDAHEQLLQAVQASGVWCAPFGEIAAQVAAWQAQQMAYDDGEQGESEAHVPCWACGQHGPRLAFRDQALRVFTASIAYFTQRRLASESLQRDVPSWAQWSDPIDRLCVVVGMVCNDYKGEGWLAPTVVVNASNPYLKDLTRWLVATKRATKLPTHVETINTWGLTGCVGWADPVRYLREYIDDVALGQWEPAATISWARV